MKSRTTPWPSHRRDTALLFLSKCVLILYYWWTTRSYVVLLYPHLSVLDVLRKSQNRSIFSMSMGFGTWEGKIGCVQWHDICVFAFGSCSLYRGKLGLDAAEAQHLMEGLDWPGAVADIAASAKWLKKNGSPKVELAAKQLTILMIFVESWECAPVVLRF